MQILLNIIRRSISLIRTIQMRRKFTIGKEFSTSRFAEIRIQDGSTASDIVIGNSVMLHGRLISQCHGKIVLGDFVNIRQGTIIGSACAVNIGVGTIISNDVTIMDNNNHPTCPVARKMMVRSGWGSASWNWRHSDAKPIEIGNNVWIGQFARVGKGVTIGENSIIAANSVVVHDVPPNSVVAGNPAKVVKSEI